MTTARLTIGSLFTTVTKTAETATQTLDVVGIGVGMLHAYAKQAATQQAISLKADHETFLDNLKHAKSKEISEFERQADEYCNQSPDHKRRYEAAYARMEALFATEEHTSKLRLAAGE